MNREMRRLQEREERRRKKEEGQGSRAQRKAAQMQARSGGAPVERKSIVNRLRDYLHEVRQELRKVTWPTREQMIAFTAVTVITSTILTAVIFGLDVAAKEGVLWLVELRS